MTGGASIVVLVASLMAALWAGLLVLAEEAPTVPRALGDPPSEARDGVPLYRALQVSRLALLLLAGVGTASVTGWWQRPLPQAAATAAITIGLLFLVADALPRGLGMLLPRLAEAVAPVARRTLMPFRPLLGLITALEHGAHSLMPRDERPDDVSREERDMLAGVLSLRERTVEEVMTPRLDVFAVEAHASWREVVEQVRRSEHARIPVYSEDLDDIVGILYAKDLAPAVAGITDPPAEWRELVRPAQFVPESKSLVAQLRDFQRGPAHLAIVVDEFGGTSGLVTLEDVLEEVVGEIHGEYDADEEPEIEREGDDKLWVDGTVSLDQLSGELGTEIERENVSTVGGLIYSELGRVPSPGDEFQLGDYRVVVEQVVRRRIRRVYFERLSGTNIVETGSERNE